MSIELNRLALPLSSMRSLAVRVAQIFANGGVTGAQYVFGNSTSLFQDSAGRTPVTAVEQPVGLMLDSEYGLVRGPELVPDGTFSGGVGAWVSGFGGATVTASAGGLLVTNVGANLGRAVRAVPTVVGKAYEITGTLVSTTTSIARFAISTASNGTSETVLIDSNIPGSRRAVFYATATTTYVTLINQSPTTDALTTLWGNISVKLLDGNHATQATAAARPVLSERVNLLTSTQDLTTASWSVAQTGATLTRSLVSTTLPDGSTGNATRLVISAIVGAQLAFVFGNSGRAQSATENYTRRVMIRRVSGGTQVGVNLESTTSGPTVGGYTDGLVTVTDNWQAYGGTSTLTGTPAGNLILAIGLDGRIPSQANLPAITIDVYDADLRLAQTGIPPYQRVNTATDYDTAGFPNYLKFDGIDDSLSSATGGGGTAGFFFCAAVRLDSTTNVRSLFCDRNASFGGYEARVANSAIELVAGNGTAFTVLTGGTVAVNTATLLTYFDDGATLSVQVNSSAPVTVARPVVVAGLAAFTLGKDSLVAANFLVGQSYSPVYVRNSGLTAAQRATVQAYVRQQAGL